MLRKIHSRGTWVAQSVKRPTLDFGSGHDLAVHEFEPLRTVSAEPAWDSLSSLRLSLSLKINKLKKKKDHVC